MRGVFFNRFSFKSSSISAPTLDGTSALSLSLSTRSIRSRFLFCDSKGEARVRLWRFRFRKDDGIITFLPPIVDIFRFLGQLVVGFLFFPFFSRLVNALERVVCLFFLLLFLLLFESDPWSTHRDHRRPIQTTILTLIPRRRKRKTLLPLLYLLLFSHLHRVCLIRLNSSLTEPPNRSGKPVDRSRKALLT